MQGNLERAKPLQCTRTRAASVPIPDIRMVDTTMHPHARGERIRLQNLRAATNRKEPVAMLLCEQAMPVMRPKNSSYCNLWQANARRAERSHREAGKKEQALKGLRKGRIPYAAVAWEDAHTHNLACQFAPTMGGELSENGVRLGVDFFTTLLQSVMFCLASHYLS